MLFNTGLKKLYLVVYDITAGIQFRCSYSEKKLIIPICYKINGHHLCRALPMDFNKNYKLKEANLSL